MEGRGRGGMRKGICNNVLGPWKVGEGGDEFRE
jgi:hypothetical protein